MLRTACIQMNSGVDVVSNLKVAGDFVRKAASHGAKFIVTPENTGAMIFDKKDKLNLAYGEDEHPALSFFSDLARDVEISILVGSLAIKVSDTKLANRSYLFGSEGQILANYQKIHLFDVDLGSGEMYRESDVFEPGDTAVLAQMPWGKLGLGICYDMRFPYLFRDMARDGAQIITLPSAFTVPTGRAHWHVMLRARAIETGCFVVAPAQCGVHDGGRVTYGHSLIVDPWGKVLAEADEEPGVIYADLDLSQVDRAREAIPQLRHDRSYDIKRV